jgi:hypothetical protein
VNFYKIIFDKNDTDARKAFQMAVQLHYGSDLWGPCETSFILLGTPNEPAEVMKKIEISTDPRTSELAGVSALNLQLGAARADDPHLPEEARQWLVEQIKNCLSIDELTKAPPGPGYRPLA